jgi:hypothetical protein
MDVPSGWDSDKKYDIIVTRDGSVVCVVIISQSVNTRTHQEHAIKSKKITILHNVYQTLRETENTI